jgi:hypothetical protein
MGNPDWRDDEYIRDNEVSAIEDEPVDATASPPAPPGVVQMYPYIDPTLWRWQAPMHLRAPHPRGGHVLVVVGVDGSDAVGGYATGAGAERAEYAKLHEVRARVAAHREACEQGTPGVRDDGRCVWCGRYADKHSAPDAPDRPEPFLERADLDVEVDRLRTELFLAREDVDKARGDLTVLRQETASALAPIGTALESLRRRLTAPLSEEGL